MVLPLVLMEIGCGLAVGFLVQDMDRMRAADVHQIFGLLTASCVVLCVHSSQSLLAHAHMPLHVHCMAGSGKQHAPVQQQAKRWKGGCCPKQEDW
jgi:hypothetical protein